MNSQEQQLQSSLEGDSAADGSASGLPVEPDPSMDEFFRLQWDLLLVAVLLTGIIFVSTWIYYSLNTSLNYLIGSCAGIFYLRMLAKHVEQLGRQRKQLGQTRLAVLVILILVASRLEQLEILPIFLGFLTYKASLIVYVLRTTLMSSSK